MRASFALVVVLVVTVPVAAVAEPVSVPVDVGLGPAAYFPFGRVAEDQFPHYGLKLSVAAVLDQAFIAQHQDRVPQRYRRLAKGVDEVRISPSILIPDALFISPKVLNTGIYGVTWRPISLGVPFGNETVKLRIAAGLLLTYFYLYSDTLPDTHFIRPGAELGAELEIAVTRSFLLSFGWASGLYVPQKLGGFAVGPIDDPDTLWHIGQAFLKLHVRFPYEINLR